METILHGNPLIASALIVEQGRPEPLLIVEPKFSVYEEIEIRLLMAFGLLSKKQITSLQSMPNCDAQEL
jgi:hypothetical protein